MLLEKLDISSFRNIERALIDASPGINLVIGPNASGKTSLLEAIYYLSWARSFRSSLTRDLIRHGDGQFTLVARMRSTGRDRRLTLGIKRQQKRLQIRCQGESIHSSSLLTRNFPVLLLGSDSFQLLTEGPRQRRRLMDWCLFHVEQDYLPLLKKYQQVLAQRNACLRLHATPRAQVQAWDRQLHPLVTQLHNYRQSFIPKFEERLKARWAAISDQPVTVSYVAGWDTGVDYAEELNRRLPEDIKRGYTRLGPHTANMRFKVANRSVSHSLSRGQLKSFIACVILTQADIYRQYHDDSPCLLVDDLPAELDGEARGLLMSIIKNSGLQTFVTATHQALLGELDEGQTLFHVEHGRLEKVVS